MSEFDQQVEALQTLLATAKEAEHDTPEQLREILPLLVQSLTSLYRGLYQWYQGIGAPGGESPEQFNAWLKTAQVTGEGVSLEAKYRHKHREGDGAISERTL